MAFAYVASTTAGASSPSANITTTGITTTGADLLVFAFGWYQGSGGTPSIDHDTYSNSWTHLTDYADTYRTITVYYAKNASVGSGHQVFTTHNVSGDPYVSVCFGSFSGSDLTAPLDSENGNTGGSGTQLIQTVTPSVNDCLLVSFYTADSTGVSEVRDDGGSTTWGDTGSGPTVNPVRETIQDSAPNHCDCAFSFRILSGGSGSASGVKWHNFPNTSSALHIACFKPAGGAAASGFKGLPLVGVGQ